MAFNPALLPALPGVYFFKDASGTVLYIGKAKSLKARVQSYFHTRPDWKIKELLESFSTVDHIVTTTEHEALLLEAHLIQQHKPRFNALLKEGQPFIYILFTEQSLPEIKLVRTQKEKGIYIGPFLHKKHARSAYAFLCKTFRLKLCHKKVPNGCLDYHLGYCAGSCKTDFDLSAYKFRLSLALNVLKQNQDEFIQQIKVRIAELTKQYAFEEARILYTYLQNCQSIFNTINEKFSPDTYETEIFTATTPHPFVAEMPDDIDIQLQNFFLLDAPIATIDCFDISHLQGRSMVGACVRFKNGIPQPSKFRRFIIKTVEKNNDYAALHEIISRRYTNRDELPDLVVIDGGKGQLSVATAIIPPSICASLAKREETVYAPNLPSNGVKLDLQTPVGKLLIALRDYTHHFAITYHRLRRKKSIIK